MRPGGRCCAARAHRRHAARTARGRGLRGLRGRSGNRCRRVRDRHDLHDFAGGDRIARVVDHAIACRGPETISTRVPKSRPICTRSSAVRPFAATVATVTPSGRNSALTGSSNAGAALATTRCACAYAPGSSAPSALSTSISTRSVRVTGSIAPAVRDARTPRILLRGQVDRRTGRDVGRAVLRHVDEHAQRAGLLQMEQLAGQAGTAWRATRGDERADVDVARGDHAVERCADRFVRHQLVQVRDVRLRGREHRTLRVHVGHLRVGVPLRHRLRRQHVLPALRGRFRIVVVRLRGGRVGARATAHRDRARRSARAAGRPSRARRDPRSSARYSRWCAHRSTLPRTASPNRAASASGRRRRAGRDHRYRQRLLRGHLRALRGARIDARHDTDREQRGGERDGGERHGQPAGASAVRRVGRRLAGAGRDGRAFDRAGRVGRVGGRRARVRSSRS